MKGWFVVAVLVLVVGGITWGAVFPANKGPLANNSADNPLTAGQIWANCLPPANCDAAYGGREAFVTGTVDNSGLNGEAAICFTTLATPGYPYSQATLQNTGLPIFWNSLYCDEFASPGGVQYGERILALCTFVSNPSEVIANISETELASKVLGNCSPVA